MFAIVNNFLLKLANQAGVYETNFRKRAKPVLLLIFEINLFWNNLHQTRSNRKKNKKIESQILLKYFEAGKQKDPTRLANF